MAFSLYMDTVYRFICKFSTHSYYLLAHISQDPLLSLFINLPNRGLTLLAVHAFSMITFLLHFYENFHRIFLSLAWLVSSIIFFLQFVPHGTEYGKGDWRSISRYYVLSNNPNQVVSHAQKYFWRQNISTQQTGIDPASMTFRKSMWPPLLPFLATDQMLNQASSSIPILHLTPISMQNQR